MLELFHGHHNNPTNDKGTTGWTTCLYLQVYKMVFDAVQDSKQYIITADGTAEWLGAEEFLLATIVRQFLVSFHKEAVPILYKSLQQKRLGAHQKYSRMLYFEVNKKNIWNDIPLSKEDIVRGASLSTNLDLGQSNNTDFSGEASKVLDGIKSWTRIHDVDFNLKQTLMMGIYASTLMNGQGNQSTWAKLLEKSGKSVANVLWEVLRGERPPASAKDKGHNLTDDVSLLKTVALSGVMSVFGDKNSFAELAKNLGAKFKNIKKSQLGNERYKAIVLKTYCFFKDFQFQSSTGIYNSDCKKIWSLSALNFWHKVAEKVKQEGSKVNKGTILVAIENIEATREFELSNDDEYGNGDPITNADVSLEVAIDIRPLCSARMTHRDKTSSPQFTSSLESVSSNTSTSNNVITPESVIDHAVASKQNSDNQVLKEDTETLLLHRYESNVTGTPQKEGCDMLTKFIDICNKVTNGYGAIDDDSCKSYDWISDPTEADFQALVAEDMDDLADA